MADRCLSGAGCFPAAGLPVAFRLPVCRSRVGLVRACLVGAWSRGRGVFVVRRVEPWSGGRGGAVGAQVGRGVPGSGRRSDR